MNAVPPKLSIVIPTCGRPALLSQCLDRLAPGRQSLAADQYEVIVTDDSARETAETMVQTRYTWARWTAGPRRGPAANRNHGARAALGEWLVFTDDDCLPEPGWLAAFGAAVDTADVLEGKTMCPGKTDNPLEDQIENLTGNVLWSCNFAIRRATFAELGGFDEDFGEACAEDMNLHTRLLRAGHPVRFCAEAVVLHPPRVTGFGGLWRRTLRHRWHVLRWLKSSPSLRDEAFPFLAVRLTFTELLSRLRGTARALLRRDPARWRTQLFMAAWHWLTFPLIMPYLLFWAARFRASGAAQRTNTPDERPR
jgi:GT2 family glycosyltransferase